MLNMTDFQKELPERLLKEVSKLVSSGVVRSVSRNDEGCYDALIRDKGAEFWAEVTLDENANIEDCYCQLCNSIVCVHTTAMLFVIGTMQCAGTDIWLFAQ